jgi:hypothetical protein
VKGISFSWEWRLTVDPLLDRPLTMNLLGKNARSCQAFLGA